jgi:hypothetical protein
MTLISGGAVSGAGPGFHLPTQDGEEFSQGLGGSRVGATCASAIRAVILQPSAASMSSLR